MNGYTLTKVFNINGKLFVADSIEKAIKLYKNYYKDPYVDIENIRKVTGSTSIDSDAIIEEIPSFEQVCNYIETHASKIVNSYGVEYDIMDFVNKMLKDIHDDLNEPH